MKPEQQQLINFQVSQEKKCSPSRGFLSALIVCLVNLSVGCVFSYTSPALPNINSNKHSFHLSLGEQALVSNIVNVGAFFATLFSGFCLQRHGRKLCLLSTIVLFVLGWLILICANGLILLLIGRFLNGMCLGLSFVLVPGYLAEITTAKMRDNIGAYSSVQIEIGLLLMHFFGMFLSWRYLGLLCIAQLAITMLMLLYVPESPRWLLSHGQDSAALQALQLLRGAHDNLEDEFQEMKKHINEAPSSFTFRDVWSKGVRKRFLISLTLALFQVLNGIDYVWYFTLTIFESSGVQLSTHMQTNLFGISGVLGCIMSVFVLGRFGRRPVLLASAISMACSLLALGFFFKMTYVDTSFARKYLDWLPITAMFTYQMAFSIGWGPLPYIVINELLPMRARPLCSSIIGSVLWLIIFLTTLFSVNIVQSSIHEYGLFWLYSSAAFASIPFVLLFVPETKGKTLEEIDDYYKN